MVRDRNVYRCQQCGFASPKPGTCPDCKRMTGELMALVEERAAPEPGGRLIGLSSSRPRALSDITMEHTDRLRTGIGELDRVRSEEHTSELQSRRELVCRLLLEKKKR